MGTKTGARPGPRGSSLRETGKETEINPQIREAAHAVAGVVTMPGVVQLRGTWRPGGECCVGARLAYALNVESGDFRDGKYARLCDQVLMKHHVLPSRADTADDVNAVIRNIQSDRTECAGDI